MPDTPNTPDQTPHGPDNAPPGDAPGTLVSVVGMAGGVGTSMLAINLAVELRDITGDGVALVDLEHKHGQTAEMLALRPPADIKDLFCSRRPITPPLVEKLLAPHESGVRVLAHLPRDGCGGPVLPGDCAEVLRCLKQGYRYLVTDGPPRYDVASRIPLALADVVILMLRPTVTCLRTAHRTLYEFGLYGHPDRERIVFCACAAPDDLLDQAFLEKELSWQIRYSIPYDVKTVSAALHAGKPLLKTAPESPVRKAIRALAEDIAGGLFSGAASQSRPPGAGPSPACTMAPLIKPPSGLSAQANRPQVLPE